MRVSVVQYDIAWCNPQENIRRAERLICGNPPSDLYLLPEMWDTGFVIEAGDVARAECESDSLRWMLRTAAERGCAVVGSMAVRDGDNIFNRMYFVTEEGILARYDKRHLFRIGGETKRFTAGSERIVAEWRGVRFLLQICYDLRFPVWSRNRDDYDAAIYAASWPVPRMGVWETLTKARAIENQCWVIAANRIGRDPYCEYNGGSVIVDACGHAIAGTSDAEGLVTAELDMAALRDFRRKFPVGRDSDRFTLECGR